MTHETLRNNDLNKLTFIFDYDGTICETSTAISKSLSLTFKNFNKTSPSIEFINELIGTGKTLQEVIFILRGSFDQLSPSEMKEWSNFYRDEYNRISEDQVYLFDGCAETLEILKKRANLILLSNKGVRAIETSLKRFRIHTSFDLILGEEPNQAKKPDIAVYLNRICPAFPTIRPENCVVVGDTVADLEFAKNIKAKSCFAAYGYGDPVSCEAVGYNYRLNHLSELIKIFYKEII